MANTNSGVKQLLMNTRERAISADVNTAQQYSARSRAEIARMWYDTLRIETTSQSSEEQHTAISVTPGTPLHAIIFGGFNLTDLVNDLNVAGGDMAVVFPDGTPEPDDSPYRLIEDGGSTNGTTLTFAANVGPGSRVDILEVQPLDVSGTPVSRDVRSTVTNQFAPQLVVKEKITNLSYRIRQGTPGSGVPVSVNDWLPIYAINTPVGAVDYTTCDIYDLRPEVSERPFVANQMPGKLANSELITYSVNVTTAPGSAFYNGATWGWGVPGDDTTDDRRYTGPSKFGGNFTRANAPGPDGVLLNLNDARNIDNVSPPVAGEFAHVVAVFPQGLPRWQLCLRADRQLRHPCRGIVVVSAVECDDDGSGAGATASVPDIGEGFYRTLGPVFAPAPDAGDIGFAACNDGLALFTPENAGVVNINFMTIAATMATISPTVFELNLSDASLLRIKDIAVAYHGFFQIQISGVVGGFWRMLAYGFDFGDGVFAANTITPNLDGTYVEQLVVPVSSRQRAAGQNDIRVSMSGFTTLAASLSLPAYKCSMVKLNF